MSDLVKNIQRYARYFKNDWMNYAMAESLAQPYIDEYNRLAKETAKRMKCSAKTVDFSFFVR